MRKEKLDIDCEILYFLIHPVSKKCLVFLLQFIKKKKRQIHRMNFIPRTFPGLICWFMGRRFSIRSQAPVLRICCSTGHQWFKVFDVCKNAVISCVPLSRDHHGGFKNSCERKIEMGKVWISTLGRRPFVFFSSCLLPPWKGATSQSCVSSLEIRLPNIHEALISTRGRKTAIILSQIRTRTQFLS